MKNILLGILAMCLCVSAFAVATAEKDKSKEIDSLREEVTDLKRTSKSLQDSVETLRRDQVNYRVEKDLLKETYSSNWQTINQVITIVLGVFAILGYLGMRSVDKIKVDYTKELQDLRGLKEKLESEIKDLTSAQKAVKEELAQIIKTNEQQDRRLKVLEIKEKVEQLFGAQKYGLALEFADAGLELDPGNSSLMHRKALCHYKFAQFETGINVFKKILEVNPKDISAITNTAEGMLLISNVEEFDKHYASFKEIIDKNHNGVTIVYLNALRAVCKADISALKVAIKPYVDSCPDGAAARFGTWGFDEIRWYIRNLPNGPTKELINTFIQFLSGAQTTQVMKEALAKAP